MNNQFWNNLLSISLSVEEIAKKNNADALTELVAYLETIDITYQRTFDPADAYHEYVAVTLCRVVANTLNAKELSHANSEN